MAQHELFLEVAHRIGRRIVEHALWDGDACTWEVWVPDRSRPAERRSVSATAGGTIYQGTAGIALFLGELYRTTQDPAIGRTAEGAVRHALMTVDQLSPSHFGFHTGRVGIAYSAARAAQQLDKPAYLSQAEQILMPMQGQEDQDRQLDVIGGAAGAIPALLQLADVLDPDLVLAMAERLGEHLIHLAHREPIGWSWQTISPAAFRNILGLGHGAAGIGHALLELYHITHSDHYRYAAEQAFLYERVFFNEHYSNWPDFRHKELGEYTYNKQQDKLLARLRNGEALDFKLKHMSAWCHGAPGIGLTRLRAYELLQDQIYKAETAYAIEATRHTLDLPGNYSLCHGHGGNCDLLLEVAHSLGDDALRERAERCGLEGWHTFEKTGRPWPCGTLQATPDPSLMLGEAGIGYFYLRLYAPETPPLLLLRALEHAPRPGGTVRQSAQMLQTQYVDTFFSRTCRVLDAFRIEQPDVVGHPTYYEPDVLNMCRALKACIEMQPASLRTQLQDAFLPEQIRYEMTTGITDFSEEYQDALRYPSNWKPLVAEMKVGLAPHTQIVQTQWDWDAWLNADSTDAALLTQTPVFFLLYRKNNRIHEQRLGLFAALVLQQLEKPVSLEELVNGVQRNLADAEALAPEKLKTLIIQQLENAYEMGFVRYHTQQKEHMALA